jgi:hypothetical protein
VPNLLTPAPNDFWISALHNGSAGPQDLAKLVIDDGCEMNIATLIDAVTRYNLKAATLAAAGVNVNTGGWENVSTSLRLQGTKQEAIHNCLNQDFSKIKRNGQSRIDN